MTFGEEMKRYTQAEFEAFPVVDGWKQFPTGDYSDIRLFGERCNFGAGCSFGAWCSFGEGCNFGEGCILENDKKLIGSTVYAGGGFGSDNRTTYGIPTKDELWIRCGCWFGTVDELRKQVTDRHGNSDIAAEYAALADLFVMRWRRELKAMK